MAVSTTILHFFCNLLVIAGQILAASWEPRNPAGDALREVENPTVVGLPLSDRMYFFGGLKSDFATQTNFASNDLFRYDIGSNLVVKLHPVGSLPPPRIFHGSWAVTRKTFMIAGGGSYDFFFGNLSFFDDFWKYNTDTNAWTRIYPSGDPFPAVVSFVVQKTDLDTVYLFGGVDSTFQATGGLFKYDILQNRLTQLFPSGPVPPNRYHAYSFASWKGFVIFGGVDTQARYIDDMWEYDTDDNEWTKITVQGPPPPNRTHGVTGKKLNKVILAMGDKFTGGRICGGAIFPQSPANDTWSFDTLTRRWTELTVDQGSVTPPLKYSAFDDYLGSIYAFAGYAFDNDTCVQTHNTNIWKFDIPLW